MLRKLTGCRKFCLKLCLIDQQEWELDISVLCILSCLKIHVVEVTRDMNTVATGIGYTTHVAVDDSLQSRDLYPLYPTLLSRLPALRGGQAASLLNGGLDGSVDWRFLSARPLLRRRDAAGSFLTNPAMPSTLSIKATAAIQSDP